MQAGTWGREMGETDPKARERPGETRKRWEVCVLEPRASPHPRGGLAQAAEQRPPRYAPGLLCEGTTKEMEKHVFRFDGGDQPL